MTNKSSLYAIGAAFAVTLAAFSLPASAQTTAQPSTAEKVTQTGKDVVDATKNGAVKAYDATTDAGSKAYHATKKGATKAYKATKKTTKKAWHATKKGVSKAADATSNAADATAGGIRTVGNKIGEKVPGTEQYDAAKAAEGAKK